MASYPFSALVGQDDMRRALILNLVDPSIGGVLIQGEKGTGKTTAVRALPALMGGDLRVVELPLGASEDRLVGTVNLKTLMREGEWQFEPGLLSEADGNILYVDEVNLLEDYLVDILLDAAATGTVHVERDGVSYTHPSRFVLVGTMNPEEGRLRPQLLDRFGLCVRVESDLSVAERVEVVRRRNAFERDPAAFCARFAKEQERLCERVRHARETCGNVVLDDATLAFVAQLCSAMGVDGYRADITVAKAAAALAALAGRLAVRREDVLAAARLAVPHRLRRAPFDDEETLRRRFQDTIRNVTTSEGDADAGASPGEADEGVPLEQGGGPKKA